MLWWSDFESFIAKDSDDAFAMLNHATAQLQQNRWGKHENGTIYAPVVNIMNILYVSCVFAS